MPTNALVLAGGLGNQLFQFAFSLCQENQQNIIIEDNLLDNSKNSSGQPELYDYYLPENLLLNNKLPKFPGLRSLVSLLIRFSAKDKLTSLERTLLIVTSLSASVLFSARYRRIVFCRAACDVGYFESKVFQNQVNVGYFQTYKWLQSNLEALGFMRKMQLASSFENLIRYEKLSKEEQPLCVHVRLGDYVNEPRVGILPTKYYEEAIHFQFDNFNYKKIWLFSNDPEQAIGFIPPEFKSRVRIIESDLTSAQTLEVMRLCAGYVIANSTFSWWGAFLSKQHAPLVVCPQKWFKISNDPNLITPPTWHRIISFP
jgi:hypothetical protein